MRWRKTPERAKTRIEKRVERIPTGELLTWADQTIFATGRSLRDYIRTGDVTLGKEAEEGAEALLAIVREARHRLS